MTGLGRSPLALRATLVAVLGAVLMTPLWALPSGLATTLAGACHFVTLAIALTGMVRAARSGDPAAALFRWCLAGCLATVALGSLIGLGYSVTTGSIPVPSAGDITLVWVPIAIYAFWRVPRRDGCNAVGRQLVADIAVAVTSLALASFLWIIEPLDATGRWSPVGEAVQLSYPVLDVAVGAMVLSLLTRVRADLRPFLNCVAGGLLLVIVSDSGSALLLAQRGTASFGWPDVTLQAGMGLLAFAARLRSRTVLVDRPASSRLDRNLPYVPIGLAAGLALLHVALVGPLTLEQSSVGAAMLAAIVWRQALSAAVLAASAESHRTAAGHDVLTGLANRKAFLARLSEHLVTPGAPPAAVVLFDLDGFKEVNDTLGHEAGDEVLVAFAATLRAAAGDGLAARLGGDEFALLVNSEADPERAAMVLAGEVNARSLERAQGGPRGITSSAGVALLRAGDSPSDVMRRADQAMYAAKHGTGTDVRVFTPDLAARASRRSQLLRDIGGAADRHELHLVYQPLYRLSDGELVGAEVLLRWDHPLLGAVAPDEFIPLAEDAGAIVAVGQWVRETAFAQVAAWDRTGRELPRLFLNVAAVEFTHSIVGVLADQLARHSIGPDRIVLEVTESRLPGPEAVEIMMVLRATGLHLALDDFGTGYSSLAQLTRLPVDILKIDRGFIAGLDEHNGRALLDAIVNLGRALGLTTVAEGVEHLAQAAEAANAGLDVAQGYLFSRPLPAEQLGALLGVAPPAVPPPRDSSDGVVAAARPAATRW